MSPDRPAPSSRGLVYALVALVSLVGLFCCPLAFPFQIVLDLALGWVLFIVRVVPQVTVSWAGVATGAVCLGLFAIGTHAFLRWLHAQMMGREAVPWRPRWTTALVTSVVLMFAAGLAAAGMVHQVGWLLAGREPLLSSGHEAVRRIQSTNNLKQIGIALDNYEGVYKSLPAGGTFDPYGRGMHGWAASLLPYLEQQAMYDRIDFAIPWDHPANAPVYRITLHVLTNPAIRLEAATDGFAPAHYAGNAWVLGGDIPRTLANISDGTETTVLAGEVPAGFKPWGHPANWRDPSRGINRAPGGFGSPFTGGTNILFADGSVRFLKDSIDPKVLRALGTPDGGEAIGPDAY